MDVDPVNTPAAPANGDSEAQRDRASLSSGATSNTADVPLDAEVSGILDGSDAPGPIGKLPPKSAEVPLVHYDFGRDDKVWAKLIGFPWWPCKVRAPKDEDGLVRVRFFGTGESCKVRSTSKEVRPWEGELSFVGEALRAKLPEKGARRQGRAPRGARRGGAGDARLGARAGHQLVHRGPRLPQRARRPRLREAEGRQASSSARSSGRCPTPTRATRRSSTCATTTATRRTSRTTR